MIKQNNIILITPLIIVLSLVSLIYMFKPIPAAALTCGSCACEAWGDGNCDNGMKNKQVVVGGWHNCCTVDGDGVCQAGYCDECGCAGSSSSSSCFTGNTKIETHDGEKEIKDIKEGDVVKSFDPDTGEIIENTVVNPYHVTRDHIYTITTSDGSVVQTTNEHPFYVGSELDQLPKTTKDEISEFFSRMKIYWVSGIHVLKTSL